MGRSVCIQLKENNKALEQKRYYFIKHPENANEIYNEVLAYLQSINSRN